MRDRYKFREQMKKKSRLEIVKSWMTSFVVAASAIVVAVTVIPTSPKAEINRLQTFENQVVYQVEITDEDNAILLDTLEVRLDNQFENYTQDLSLGVNVGIFENLSPDTSYQMSILGDKGFGKEVLAHQVVQTEPKSGGAILSYQLMDSVDPYQPVYDMSILLSDPLSEYTSVTLYYGVIYFQETEPYSYTAMPISNGLSTVTLDQIYQLNVQVYCYLEATLSNNDTIILDELTFSTPVDFEIYYYLEQVSDTQITLSLYPEFYMFSHVTYEFKLYKDGLVAATKSFSSDDLSDPYMQQDVRIIFDHLRKDTLYELEVSAFYQNPYTLQMETKTAELMEIRTLPAFSYSFQITTYDLYYEVTVLLTDPNHNYQNVYYELYETGGEFDNYITGENFGFTPIGESKTTTFTIDKNSNLPYRIDIGVMNETNTIYHQIIDQIDVKE